MFDSIFHEAVVGMAIIDASQGKWLRVNNSLCMLLGRSAAELLSGDPEQLVHPKDRDSKTGWADRVIRGATPRYTVEKRFLQRNGAPIPCRLTCSRLPGAGEDSPKLLLQLQPLRRPLPSRSDKTALFLHSVDLLAVANTAGYLEEVNPAWEEALGWSVEELQQTPFIEFVHPDDRDRTIAEAQQVYGGRPTHRFRNRYKVKNGGYRWLEWNIRPEPCSDLFCTVRDVTEQVALEDELREISQHLNQVTESVPALLFQWYAAPDGSSGFTYFNGRSDELYGVDRETLMRDWRHTPVHPDDWPMVEASIEKAVREQSNWMVECRMVPPNGQIRWVHCESTPTSITETEIVFTGVILDITEQYRARQALEESETRFRSLAEGSLQGIIVESIVDGHRPLFVNEAAARIYGFNSAAEVMALPSISHLVVPDTLSEGNGSWQALASGDINCVNTRIQARRKDGSPFWVELMGTLIQWQGKPAFQMTLLDVTEAHLAQEALRASERRLRTIADNLPILMAYVDRSYRYRFTNQTYSDWFNVPLNQLYGMTVLEVVDRKLYALLLPYMNRALKGERVRFEIEGEGTGLPPYCEFLYIPDFDSRGEVAGFYSMVIDITDRRQHAMLLEEQALQDSLTGLLNRRGLVEYLPLAIGSSRQKGGALAILFLDLDRFKQINDKFGHEVGDQLLVDFSRRLKGAVRQSDFVVRLSGDEFVILLTNLVEGQKTAEIVAEKVLAAMIAPFSFGETSATVSTSIGICVRPAERAKGNEMLKLADEAMYRAKHEGRNRYCFAALT